MTDNNLRLFMVRLRLETRSLFELARRRKIVLRDMDTGYAVHCYLKELFGVNAPAPFAVTPFVEKASAGRFLTVVGYTRTGKEELENYAQALSDPAVYEGCDWSRMASKPLPAKWPHGARFAFEVRACPTVRKGSEGPFHKKGAEVDVFISRCWEVSNPDVVVSREQVYGQWLSNQIDRIGGAKLRAFKLKAFERECLFRRDHLAERKFHRTEKPSAIFGGSLEVTDSALFTRLMQRGIGRHRAFGFGMLLLRNEG
jgi:CRISPR system Cascade subunit CasE